MTDLGTIVNGDTIRFERMLPAPVQQVWELVTSPRGLAAWLAPGDVELKTGGRIELRFEPGTDVAQGEVTACTPPRLFEFTWNESAGERPDSLVRFELEEAGDQTRLVLTHTRLAAGQIPGFGAGWQQHLELLAAACRGQARPDWDNARHGRLLDEYRELVSAARRARR